MVPNKLNPTQQKQPKDTVTQNKLGLVGLYDVWPNGSGVFLQPQRPI